MYSLGERTHDMQNKILKITRMGFALVILAFGALPALAQGCEGWEDIKFSDEGDILQKITLEQVQTCLNNGMDVHARGKNYKMTPLYWAGAFNKDPQVIIALLNAGADVSARDTVGRTPLHFAAENNKNAKIITILIQAGADVNARDRDGGTPLHEAAEGNISKVIITLLNAGADVNARSEKHGWTPLHWAAYNKNPKVITALLNAGADVGARDTYGSTPLHVATEVTNNNQISDMIMVLLQAGADGKAKDSSGRIPFDYAKENEALTNTKAYWALNDVRF